MKNTVTYSDSGVSIDAGNALVDAVKPLARQTRRGGVMGGIGGFGGFFDPKAAGFHDPILVAANDGVGTKLKLAIDSGIHDTVGIDLVAMCANDLVVQGAEPLFFLDYFAAGTLDIQQARTVIAGIAKGCTEAGCALIGGETAEMPGMYAAGDYDLAGFCVGAVERGEALNGENITVGDVVLGLASTGLHSNGFSLIRRILARDGLGLSHRPPFSGTEHAETLGEVLLTPTRLYVRSGLAVLKELKGADRTKDLRAFAHITGGGLDENIPRVLPEGLSVVLEPAAWQAPAVFRWLHDAGVERAEMFRTFNCGIGMAVIVSPTAAADIVAIFKRLGETVYTIGQVQPRAGGVEGNGTGVTYTHTDAVPW